MLTKIKLNGEYGDLVGIDNMEDKQGDNLMEFQDNTDQSLGLSGYQVTGHEQTLNPQNNKQY